MVSVSKILTPLSAPSEVYPSPVSSVTSALPPAVLIIDDDDGIRALSQWVAQKAGFRALTARDGPEGLDCLKAEGAGVGLVLLDLTMPRMSGAEVVSALQSMGASTPVVLITGYGEESVRDDERIGVVGVLQKPFTPEALRSVLQQHLVKVA